LDAWVFAMPLLPSQVDSGIRFIVRMEVLQSGIHPDAAKQKKRTPGRPPKAILSSHCNAPFSNGFVVMDKTLPYQIASSVFQCRFWYQPCGGIPGDVVRREESGFCSYWKSLKGSPDDFPKGLL